MNKLALNCFLFLGLSTLSSYATDHWLKDLQGVDWISKEFKALSLKPMDFILGPDGTKLVKMTKDGRSFYVRHTTWDNENCGFLGLLMNEKDVKNHRETACQKLLENLDDLDIRSMLGREIRAQTIEEIATNPDHFNPPTSTFLPIEFAASSAHFNPSPLTFVPFDSVARFFDNPREVFDLYNSQSNAEVYRDQKLSNAKDSLNVPNATLNDLLNPDSFDQTLQAIQELKEHQDLMDQGVNLFNQQFEKKEVVRKYIEKLKCSFDPLTYTPGMRGTMDAIAKAFNKSLEIYQDETVLNDKMRSNVVNSLKRNLNKALPQGVVLIEDQENPATKEIREAIQPEIKQAMIDWMQGVDGVPDFSKIEGATDLRQKYLYQQEAFGQEDFDQQSYYDTVILDVQNWALKKANILQYLDQFVANPGYSYQFPAYYDVNLPKTGVMHAYTKAGRTSMKEGWDHNIPNQTTLEGPVHTYVVPNATETVRLFHTGVKGQFGHFERLEEKTIEPIHVDKTVDEKTQ